MMITCVMEQCITAQCTTAATLAPACECVWEHAQAGTDLGQCLAKAKAARQLQGHGSKNNATNKYQAKYEHVDGLEREALRCCCR